VRRQLADAVAKHYGEEDIAAIIEAAKGAETSSAAECPECGTTMRVKVPDFRKQLETLIALLEQAEGKAQQAQPEQTTVIIERPAR
jgi:hypothetical protein